MMFLRTFAVILESGVPDPYHRGAAMKSPTIRSPSMRRPLVRFAFALAALAGMTAAARGDVIDVVASADGYAVDPGGTGNFTSVTTSTSNDLTEFFGAGTQQDRALFLFQLPTLPPGAALQSVSFLGNVNLLGAQSNLPVSLDLVAFGTNSGALSTSDATAVGTVVGTLTRPSSVAGLGDFSVSLNAAAIESLIGSSTFVGLAGVLSSGDQIGIVPVVNTSVAGTRVPTLEFTTAAAVPEPGSIALLGLGAAVAVGLSRRSREV